MFINRTNAGFVKTCCIRFYIKAFSYILLYDFGEKVIYLMKVDVKNMNNIPELIVMLTYNDQTVDNAYEIFEKCKNSKAKYWGFKENGLSFDKMKKLYTYMRECGKITVLEVVAYSEKECLKGAETAVKCGCDILMGTLFYDSVNDYCKEHNLKYMPFIGIVQDRPSILIGSIDDMIKEANQHLKKGVYGFDLLAYRYVGNADELINKILSAINAPVCIAGSINTYQRIKNVKKSRAWAFTIGSAFFNNCFDDEFGRQIDRVCEYVKDTECEE